MVKIVGFNVTVKCALFSSELVSYFIMAEEIVAPDFEIPPARPNHFRVYEGVLGLVVVEGEGAWKSLAIGTAIARDKRRLNGAD